MTRNAQARAEAPARARRSAEPVTEYRLPKDVKAWMDKAAKALEDSERVINAQAALIERLERAQAAAPAARTAPKGPRAAASAERVTTGRKGATAAKPAASKANGRKGSSDWNAVRPDTTGMTRTERKAANRAAAAQARAARPLTDPDAPMSTSQATYLRFLTGLDTRSPKFAKAYGKSLTKAQAAKLIDGLRTKRGA